MFNFYHRLINSEENIISTCYEFTKQLNIKITRGTLKQALESHPHYPSLLSASDVFTRYNIYNFAVKLEIQKLKEIDGPFIVVIKYPTSTNLFCLIKKTCQNGVDILEPVTNRNQHITWSELDGLYQGVTFFADPRENSGESNFFKKSTEEKKRNRWLNVTFLFIPAFVLICQLYHISVGDFTSTLYNFLSLIGLLSCLLLIWYEVDNSNITLNEICGGISKTRNQSCKLLIQSKASSIFGVSWSKLGFSFFSALLFGHLLMGLNNTGGLSLLSLFTFVSAAYIPFSIIYQWKVIKKWCTLCLVTQGILMSQLIICLIYFNWHSLQSLSTPILIKFISCLAFIGVTSLFIVSWFVEILKKGRQLNHDNMQSNRLKYNPDVFNFLLSTQKKVTFPTEGLGITLGNVKSNNRIIKVCNPYCGPCSKAHRFIEELLNETQDLSVQVIFTAGTAEDDPRANPVRHMLAIAEGGEESDIKSALNTWYNAPLKDYNAFAKMHQISTVLRDQDVKLRKMEEWCTSMSISFTPTLFLNGFQLPDNYAIQDLKLLLRNQLKNDSEELVNG